MMRKLKYFIDHDKEEKWLQEMVNYMKTPERFGPARRGCIPPPGRQTPGRRACL